MSLTEGCARIDRRVSFDSRSDPPIPDPTIGKLAARKRIVRSSVGPAAVMGSSIAIPNLSAAVWFALCLGRVSVCMEPNRDHLHR